MKTLLFLSLLAMSTVSFGVEVSAKISHQKGGIQCDGEGSKITNTVVKEETAEGTTVVKQ